MSTKTGLLCLVAASLLVVAATSAAKIAKRTKSLEIGVVVSPALYNNVRKQLELKSHRRIRNGELDNWIRDSVQGMFADAQHYFRLDSISKTGGFTLIVKGIEILKDYRAEKAKPMEGVTDLDELLSKFITYAEDGNKGGNDLTILLDKDPYPDGSGFPFGIANIGSVCKNKAAGLVRVNLKRGEYTSDVPKRIAHEVGHILGARHDGERGCHYRKYIMSDTHESGMGPRHQSTWSTCSQKDIDHREELLELFENCYYT